MHAHINLSRSGVTSQMQLGHLLGDGQSASIAELKLINRLGPTAFHPSRRPAKSTPFVPILNSWWLKLTWLLCLIYMTTQEQDSPMPQHSQDSPQGALIGLGLMISRLEEVLPGILLYWRD
jgi:hypothetical protein